MPGEREGGQETRPHAKAAAPNATQTGYPEEPMPDHTEPLDRSFSPPTSPRWSASNNSSWGPHEEKGRTSSRGCGSVLGSHAWLLMRRNDGHLLGVIVRNGHQRPDPKTSSQWDDFQPDPTLVRQFGERLDIGDFGQRRI